MYLGRCLSLREVSDLVFVIIHYLREVKYIRCPSWLTQHGESYHVWSDVIEMSDPEFTVI